MAPTGLQHRKIEVLLDGVERLPTLPGVAHRLLQLLTSDRPDRRDIQLVIEADAALSARAVRLALQLGCSAESATSIDAILETVPLDALTADLLSVEWVEADVLREAHLVRLWRHTLATGMASQIIARRLGTIPPETALLAGILHDVGQIALAVLLPKAYAQILERVETTGTNLLEAERQDLGVDHAVVGKRLARQWGFSETLQHVIWLHHQAQVPEADRPEAKPLAQVVRLADLIVRHEGFTYPSSEQIHEPAADVAEGLSLSGGSITQIGHQVVTAFDLNAQPAGLNDEPSVVDLQRALAAANARLGALYRTQFDRTRRAEGLRSHADRLVRLNARLAGGLSVPQVLSAVADAACEALDLRVVVPYLVSRDGTYLEGIRRTADGAAADHFLYDLSRAEGVEPLLGHESGPPATPASPVRAERLEGWLFERQGAGLGPGPFYTLPMMVNQKKVGGLVFAPRAGAQGLTPQTIGELSALASLAGAALERAQAEADLVALSESLAEANRQLEAAQDRRLEARNVASLSEMAAGAAHEINNPLAIISGRAQQLAAGEPNAERHDHLTTIIRQAERISDIIAELRQFAKPPAPELRSVDPLSWAREVADGFQPPIPLETPASAPPIRIDPDQVAGALKELLQNAREACAGAKIGGVTLTVQFLAADQTVRFVIDDDGPGMDPQVRARAFDPFYSGYEAGRHRGLGLPKAYRVVQANGGRMTLESSPGQGTTVRVTFPIAAESPPAGG